MELLDVEHFFICVAGIIVSAYALYIEVKTAKNPKYVAMCDVSESMSCTRVLTSEYSKGFGIVGKIIGQDHPLNLPNPVTGIFFYVLLIFLGFSSWSWAPFLIFYLTVLSCIGSLYLAYILAVKIRTLCLVCFATYIVNAVLLYVHW